MDPDGLPRRPDGVAVADAVERYSGLWDPGAAPADHRGLQGIRARRLPRHADRPEFQLLLRATPDVLRRPAGGWTRSHPADLPAGLPPPTPVVAGRDVRQLGVQRRFVRP